MIDIYFDRTVALAQYNRVGHCCISSRASFLYTFDQVKKNVDLDSSFSTICWIPTNRDTLHGHLCEVSVYLLMFRVVTMCAPSVYVKAYKENDPRYYCDFGD